MIYLIMTLIVVLFTSFAHVLLKIATCRAVEAKSRLYTHPIALVAYGIFAFVAFLSIYAMKGLDLKVFFALNSLTYILIPILAYIIINEKFTSNKTIGVIIISIGVLVFNL